MKTVYTFKLDDILGEVKILKDTYTITADFQVSKYITSGWDLATDEKSETVKIRFSKEYGEKIARTIWHPSQTVEILRDGSMIMTFQVQVQRYFISWLLGLGGNVEILEPQRLRETVLEMAYSIIASNRKEKLEGNTGNNSQHTF